MLDCEVLAVEPNKTLTYTWNFAHDDAAYNLNSVVTFTLAPTSTGTHLRMEQSGFRPDQKQAFGGARRGGSSSSRSWSSSWRGQTEKSAAFALRLVFRGGPIELERVGGACQEPISTFVLPDLARRGLCGHWPLTGATFNFIYTNDVLGNVNGGSCAVASSTRASSNTTLGFVGTPAALGTRSTADKSDGEAGTERRRTNTNVSGRSRNPFTFPVTCSASNGPRRGNRLCRELCRATPRRCSTTAMTDCP